MTLHAAIPEVRFHSQILPLLEQEGVRYFWLNGNKHYTKAENVVRIFPNEFIEGWTFFSLFGHVYHVQLDFSKFRKVNGRNVLMFSFDGTQSEPQNCIPVTEKGIRSLLQVKESEENPIIIPHPATHRNELTEDMLEQGFSRIRSVFRFKNKEYGRPDNPFHNFDAAGELMGESSEKALLGMWIKHIISIRDMVMNWERDNKLPLMEQVREKCGDSMIYSFLLEHLFERTIKAHQTYKDAA